MVDKKPSTLRRIASFLKDRKKTIVFLLLLITTSQVASISVPFISKILIDSLTKFIKSGGALPLSTLAYSSLGILVITLISNMLQANYNYNLFQIITKIEDQIKNQAFEKYIRLHSLQFEDESSNDEE